MRHTYTALLLGYLLSLSTCFALDSINYTCINQSYLAARPHKNSLNTDGLTYFAIPSFSQIAIQVDLRHLPSLQILTANKITFRLLITSTNNSSFT